MRPRYITAIRSAKCAAVDRSWVIMRMPIRPSRRSLSSRVSTPARTETSSMDTGSSASSRSGAEHQRRGDRYPLALAAGQLVRVAVQEASRRGQARPFQRRDDQFPALGP